MPAPKRKVSRRKTGQTRAHDKLTPPKSIKTCPQCGEPVLMHKVCSSCGFYRGKEVIEIPLE